MEAQADDMTARPLRPCAQLGCSALVTSGYCTKHQKRQRYCKEPGCPVLITEGYYCAKHDPRKKNDAKRGGASKRGYNRSWARVRGAYIKAHPLCERCEGKGLVVQAAMVHHITPLADGGERLKWDNLQALCLTCHAQVHRELHRQKRSLENKQ